MVSCCVSGCNQESYPNCGISFHRFPTDNSLRILWINAMGLEDNVSKFGRICGLHFKSDDFASPAKVKLKPQAVPSILPEMWQYCAVKGCQRTFCPDSDVTFFRFPSNPHLKNIWKYMTGATEVSSNSTVCSLHFEDTDILYKQNNKVLKKNAVPKKLLLFSKQPYIKLLSIEESPILIEKERDPLELEDADCALPKFTILSRSKQPVIDVPTLKPPTSTDKKADASDDEAMNGDVEEVLDIKSESDSEHSIDIEETQLIRTPEVTTPARASASASAPASLSASASTSLVQTISLSQLLPQTTAAPTIFLPEKRKLLIEVPTLVPRRNDSFLAPNPRLVTNQSHTKKNSSLPSNVQRVVVQPLMNEKTFVASNIQRVTVQPQMTNSYLLPKLTPVREDVMSQQLQSFVRQIGNNVDDNLEKIKMLDYTNLKLKKKLENALKRRVEARNKHRALLARLRRCQKSKEYMKKLLNIVKEYTSQNEAENMVHGNYKRFSKIFQKNEDSTTDSQSQELLKFAITMNYYSPKAYSYLRQFLPLPHRSKLEEYVAQGMYVIKLED